MLKPINDGEWTFPEILSMVEGGNQIFVQHMKGKQKNCIFSGMEVNNEAIRKVYCGSAASTYRKSLSQRVEKAMKMQTYVM